MSHALSDWYTPDVALCLSIDGSGMGEHYTETDAFVLESLAQPSPNVLNKVAQSIEASLQANGCEAFCRELIFTVRVIRCWAKADWTRLNVCG